MMRRARTRGHQVRVVAEQVELELGAVARDPAE